MNETTRDAWLAVIDGVLRAADGDDALRNGLRAVADEVLAATSGRKSPEPVPPSTAVASVPATRNEPPIPSPPQPLVPVPGGPTVRVSVSLAGTDAPNGFHGLAALAGRCRLKARAARWAVEREQLIASGADFRWAVAPVDRELAREAKERGFYLWLLHAGGRRQPGGLEFLTLAGCYEAVAEAAGLVCDLLGGGEGGNEGTPALGLLARSQSALRFALSRWGHADEDQRAVYEFLVGYARTPRLFIDRGMRLDDPVDPAEWGEIVRAVRSIRAAVEDRGRARRTREKLLGKLRHKATVLASTPAPEAGEWDGLVAVVNDLLAGGMSPTRLEFRDALLPLAGKLPPDLRGSEPFASVVRAVDGFLANSPVPGATTPKSPSVDVARAARLLAGKAVVLIGGDTRPDAQAAIERAFGLKELVWIGTKKNQSYRDFEPQIARPDVAVVLLAIRWVSHSFANVRSLCDRHGKPLVRLPGGYNPEQVAAAVVGQASDRLEATE